MTYLIDFHSYWGRANWIQDRPTSLESDGFLVLFVLLEESVQLH